MYSYSACKKNKHTIKVEENFDSLLFQFKQFVSVLSNVESIAFVSRNISVTFIGTFYGISGASLLRIDEHHPSQTELGNGQSTSAETLSS